MREKTEADSILRMTPYEVAFAETSVESELFPAIVADAESHGTDHRHLEAFGMLPAVSEAVRALVPADAPADALEQYRALLFQGFNFWRHGRETFLLQAAAARYLVEAQPRMQGWELVAPHPSIYVQLPHNLFWGSVSPDETPEPVDGIFLTASPGPARAGQPYTRLDILLILGLRRDRAGFSVIPFDTEAGPGIAAAWAEDGSRTEGSDFENLLPGGEIEGLYSMVTVGEVLKLLGRILWYVDSFPGDVIEPAASPPPSDPAPGGVRPSRIPYRLVTLGQSER